MKIQLLIASIFIIFMLSSCAPATVRVSPRASYRQYYKPRPYYNPYYYRRSNPWGRPHHRGYYR